MEGVLLFRKEFEELKDNITEVKQRLKDMAFPEDRIVENQEFLTIMNVSYKTAKGWRDKGKIGYSKEGNKIYYRMSDIKAFLDLFYHKPFAQVEGLF